MISYGKVRSAFAWAFPLFLGCLYVLGAHLINYDHQMRARAAAYAAAVKQAEMLTIIARAGFSTSLQVEKSFREVLKELTAITESGRPAIEKNLPALVKKHLHPQISQNCRIWAFNRVDNTFKLASAPGLENSKRKAMELAFTALINLREKHSDDTTRRRNEKFISGLFGENSAPGHLAGHRRGILTPVRFEGNPYYVYWQKTGREDNINGGFVALLPGDFIEDTTGALKRLADKLVRSVSGSVFVCFPESEKVAPVFNPLHSRLNGQEKQQQAAFRSLQTVFGKNDFTRRQLLPAGGWLHYIDMISPETHFFIAISFKDESFPPPGKGLPRDLSVFSLLWSAVFFLRLRHQGFSMALAFRMLFFMTGMLPVSLFLYLGLNLIDQSKEAEIKQKIQSAYSRIEILDEKSEESVGLAGILIKEMLSDPFYQNAFISEDHATRKSGFAGLEKSLRRHRFFLNYVLIIQPGRAENFHVASPADIPFARYHLDYYVISAADLNKVLTARNPGFSQIRLNKTQQTLINSLGGEENASIKDVFLSSLERINSFQAGTVARHVFFTTILGRQSEIGCYLILAISISETVREIIRSELRLLNSGTGNRFFCFGRDLSSGFNSVEPDNQIERGETGRSFLQFLEASMHHNFRIEHNSGNSVFIYEPMNKVRHYLGGAIIDLSETKAAAGLKLFLLLIIVALLAATIYLLASAVSRLLIQPVGELNQVFKHIASGDYTCEFNYPLNNELGELARATTQMIRGLKERKLLGKFVSTTFDSGVRESHQTASARTITGTVLFSDIRSFTTISESYPPEVIARLLNTHLREMVEIIHAQSGRVEQFIGDAIVAFFPGEQETACLKALKASAMMMTAHHKIQQQRAISHEPIYEIGIGLDSGLIMAGILRSGARSEFSIIGSARSGAEACEAASKKGLATKVMLSDAVAKAVSRFDIELLQHNSALFELKELNSL